MTDQETRLLREQLTSTKAETRKKAFAELKKFSADRALSVLTSCLDAKNSDVQADLMKAIITYKDEALPHLVKAFNDPLWRVRKTAAEIIGSMGDRALSRFLALIPQNEEDVDFWMVQTLGFMGGEATPYLMRAFHHPNPRIRLAAVRAAANTGDPQIMPSLIGMLNDPSWSIRKAAYDTLSRIQHLNPEAVIEAIKRADIEAKYWLIRLAGERQDSRLIPVFCGIIEHDREEAKLEAIRALAEIQRPEAHKVL
ncbi:MAG TPA: HEAT repeat domain-containing protein, partial [Candidatus Ozemobacteraceae bacterium]|nr:HEAT repeat domain-containing protein [Candidatus Ozemobacteraceae bacterium]